MERCVRLWVSVAMNISFEFCYCVFSTKESIYDTISQVRDHRGVVIRVVPSPVRRSLVIIIEDPLKPFQVSVEQLVEFDFASSVAYVEVKFRFIVVSFCFIRVFFVCFDKFFHKIVILFNCRF